MLEKRTWQGANTKPFEGLVPMLLTPFDASGKLDLASLQRLLAFELASGARAIAVGGLASEIFSLSVQDYEQVVASVASELKGTPLLIGLGFASDVGGAHQRGSTEELIKQARAFDKYQPAAFILRPPAAITQTSALVKHYLEIAWALETPLMIQDSVQESLPELRAGSRLEQQIAHTQNSFQLSTLDLCELAHSADNIAYFRLGGANSAARIRDLYRLVGDLDIGLFGGTGGLRCADELKSGSSGVITGLGFSDVLLRAWEASENHNPRRVREILTHYQPLIKALSGKGFEHALQAKKALLKRSGIINSDVVRSVCPPLDAKTKQELFDLVDSFDVSLRL